jgi:hypothetical protein
MQKNTSKKCRQTIWQSQASLRTQKKGLEANRCQTINQLNNYQLRLI